MTLTEKQIQFNNIAAKHGLPEVFSNDDMITMFWVNQGYSLLKPFGDLEYFNVICEMVKYHIKRNTVILK